MGSTALKHLRAVLALPVVVTVVIPALLLYSAAPARFAPALPTPIALAACLCGAGLLCIGLALMVATNILFDRVGQGTLAPWSPPRRLVVRGVYRHVRNPMISGVFCILLGEAMLLLSPALLGWFLVFLCVNLIYIPLVEEPGLARRFGDEYRSYKAHVPRWIPRRRGWPPDENHPESSTP